MLCTMVACIPLILDIAGGAAFSILLHFIIWSLALFADSLTGGLFGVVVKITLDSPFFSIPSVVLFSLSSATIPALFVPAVTSNGHWLSINLLLVSVHYCWLLALQSLPTLLGKLSMNYIVFSWTIHISAAWIFYNFMYWTVLIQISSNIHGKWHPWNIHEIIFTGASTWNFDHFMEIAIHFMD